MTWKTFEKSYKFEQTYKKNCFFQWTIHDIHFVYLQDEVPSSEVGDGSWKTGSPPHEPEEQGALIVGELLHNVPEPVDERGTRVDSLVRRYWLE